MAGLFEETERLKLRFIKAYERLHELGRSPQRSSTT